MTIDENRRMHIKRGGYYYNVSGNDALILHKHLGYKIYGVNTFRTGFPVVGQDAVLKRIDALAMDYDLYDQEGNLLTSRRFSPNNYEVFDLSECSQMAEGFNKPHKVKKTVQSKRAGYITALQALGEGVNPYTGEIIAGIDEQLKNTLLEIMLYFDEKEKAQLRNKEQHINMGQRWSKEEDEELIKEYNAKMELKEIAELHNRTISAIHSRLLRLHLIKL